jgi:transcriptional regulator with XRE-family HTH domain
LEWAQVQALVADGVSEREIARRLGMNRRTVARLARSEELPRYRRTPAGSQLDPLEPVLRRLLAEWPQIKVPQLTEILRDEYSYTGSVRLVQEHLQRLRPRAVRPAQRTGYRPGQVMQLDWAEMPTRPTLAGRERRVYALLASLPYSGAQTAFFPLDLTLKSFLEGHVRAFEWLGGVLRECVFVAHAVYAGDAAREGLGRSAGALPEERLLAGAPLHRLGELDRLYADWRDWICNVRTHTTGRFPVAERLAEERRSLRPLPPARFDWSGQRTTRLPIDGYLRHGCFLPSAAAARARTGRAWLRP